MYFLGALAAYKKGVELEPTNDVLQKGLREAMEAATLINKFGMRIYPKKKKTV